MPPIPQSGSGTTTPIPAPIRALDGMYNGGPNAPRGALADHVARLFNPATFQASTGRAPKDFSSPTPLTTEDL